MRDRDVIETQTVPVGALAARLVSAERELLDAERALEDMLDSLYGRDGWSAWEVGQGAIDVYDVLPSEAAAFALFRAGFRTVREHQHPRTKFSTCACRTRRDFL